MAGTQRIALVFAMTFGMIVIVYSQCPCSPPETEVSGSGGLYYDTCTKAGTFKSKSICYEDTRPATQKIVPPYQFYTCVPYSSSFILYPRNCSGPFTVIEDTSATPVSSTHLIWNAYNENTGLCDLKNPAPVDDPMAPGGQTPGWPFCV